MMEGEIASSGTEYAFRARRSALTISPYLWPPAPSAPPHPAVFRCRLTQPWQPSQEQN